MDKVSPQATNLYKALIDRGIKCQMEAWDGHKHIDISIPWAQIDIEVDGLQHYVNPEQIKADFRRSYYSTNDDDFDTIHIPNFIIDSHLDKVADAIASVARSHYEAIMEENESIWSRIKKIFK